MDTNEDENHVTPSSTTATDRILRKRKAEYLPDQISSKRRMTSAERSRKYRNKIKDEPELYKAHRLKDTLRVKKIREELTEEQRQRYNEKTRARMKRYRDRQKEKGIARKTTHKVMTRTERENLRKKWRDDKKKYRENMTIQKKRRMNERRRQRYRNKKDEPSQLSSQSCEHSGVNSNDQGDGTGTFLSDTAKRKAISRSKKSLPKNPKKFSIVVSSLISSATPRKKTELRKQMVFSPKSKKKLDMLESVGNNLKMNIKSMNKSKISIVRKRHMVNSLIKNAKKTDTSLLKVVKGLGFSQKFLKKVENLEDLEDRKKRKDALSEETTADVDGFYERTDFIRTLPQNATKKGVKKVLECSLTTMYEEFKRDHPDAKVSYSKFVAMKPQNVLPMSKHKFMACLCEYCVNIELKIDALKSLKKNQTVTSTETVSVPLDKFELAQMTTCKNERKECIDRMCQDCGVQKIDKLFMNLDDEQSVSWCQWKRTNYTNAAGKQSVRMMKVPIEERVEVFQEKIKVDLVPFSKHLFNAKWQSKQFSLISKDVPDNTVVMCCDFAENFACRYQDEAQGAHWSYDQVTIHPVICSYPCPEESCHMVVEESFLIISDDHLHDSHAVHHYTSLAVSHLKTKGIGIEKLIQFSDGAGAQYKGKTNFADLAYGPEDLGVKVFEKHYFGSRHGKGPCDREIGTVKRSVMMAIKSRRAEVTDAKSFFAYCNSSMARPKNGEHSHFIRTSKYVTVGEINRDRPERTSLRSVKDTRKYHSFKSTENSHATKIIHSRERSCFCFVCLDGTNMECPNRDTVGDWIVNFLGGIRRRVVVMDGGNDGQGRMRVRGVGNVRRGRVRIRGGKGRGRGDIGKARGDREQERGNRAQERGDGAQERSGRGRGRDRVRIRGGKGQGRGDRLQERGNRRKRRGNRGRGRGGTGGGGRGRQATSDLSTTDEEDTSEEDHLSSDDGSTSTSSLSNNTDTIDDIVVDDNRVVGDDTVFVGNTVVGDDTVDSDNTDVGDRTVVALVSDDTVVKDNTVVNDNAVISDNTVVDDDIQDTMFTKESDEPENNSFIEMLIAMLGSGSTKHKLTLFNVCNDVVQTGKRKHAAIYVDTFRDILKDAIVHVGEDKIKSNVERILNIWKERNVFPASFVSELQESLASSKVKVKASVPKVKESSYVKEAPPPKVKETTKPKETAKSTASALASPKAPKTPINPKILAEFKPQKVIDKINNFKRLEGEVELKGKQLSNLKLDASSIEAIKQLKDKAHGKQFSMQFEDSCFKLEDFVTSIEKEIEEQQSMIEVLEHSEMFYDEQYREAKIVTNAYKNFGTRINNLKKKLDDLKESLPSPIPSPNSDAPSPGNTPPDAELEMNEAVDMDLDDEDSTSPSNIIVVKHSKRKVANTITVKCIPQPIPSVLDIVGLAGKAAAMPSKDSSKKMSNSRSGIQYIQTVGASKSLSSSGVENAFESRIAKMIPTLQPLNQHHDPRHHESEPAVYNPPPKKHSSITSLQSSERGEGTPTKDEGSSTPVMDEKPDSPSNDRHSVSRSSSSSKSQNPIDFLTQILSKTSKTTQGSSNFLQNLSLLTSTVKTQYQQQKEANSHQGTGSASPSLEQQSTPPNSWAEWKAQRQPSPSQNASPSEHQMDQHHISALHQSTSQPQDISPQKIPTLQGNNVHIPTLGAPSIQPDTAQQISPILAPSQQPILQQPPLSMSQMSQPHNPALVQPVMRPPQMQSPYQQIPSPQLPYRHDVPVPPMMPGVQVPVSGWNMPPPPQGFPMPGYLGPPPPGQPPPLRSPPWGPAMPQQPEVKVSTSDQEMSDEQTTSPGLHSPPISNQPKGILRNRKSSLREVPLTPDPLEAAREFSGGLDSDKSTKPRPPAEPPSPTEPGKSKLGRQNSSPENVNIIDDHKEFMEKLKRKTTGNSNLIAPPIVDFPDEDIKSKQQLYSKNPARPNLTTITPIDLDEKNDEKELEEEEQKMKNFTELSADESEELPIQTIKSVVTKGPQSMETSPSGENEGAPIKTIDSTVRTKIDMQGDHNDQDSYEDSDRKKYDSSHHGHRSEHYSDYYRSESHGQRDRHDSYRHHRDRPYYDPYQSRDNFYRDRYGAPIPRGYPDYYSGRRYQRY